MSYGVDLTNIVEREADLAPFAITHPEAMLSLYNYRVATRGSRFHPDPPATTDDVAAFQDLFGIVLPTSYYLFLRIVGNGVKDNAGVFVVAGIPTREMLASAEWKDELENLKKDFPLEDDAGWCGDYDDVELSEEEMEEAVDREDIHRKKFEQYERITDDALRQVYAWSNQGTWQLDSAAETVLVMNGKSSGTVWKCDVMIDHDGSGHIMLTQQGEFIDWLVNER